MRGIHFMYTILEFQKVVSSITIILLPSMQKIRDYLFALDYYLFKKNKEKHFITNIKKYFLFYLLHYFKDIALSSAAIAK